MNANHVIVRRPGGLRALRVNLSRRKVKRVKRIVVENSVRGVTPGDELCLADEEVHDLACAWRRLGKATLSERTWDDLFLLLAETPAAPVHCVEPVPRLDPRAAVDVRRWLCDPAAVANLLKQLRGFARRFADEHPRGCELWRCFYPLKGGVGDPYFLCQHSKGCRFGEPTLAPVHLEQVLPWLKGLRWTKVLLVVRRWEALRAIWPEAAWLVLSRARIDSIAGWLRFFLEYPLAEGEARAEVLRFWMNNGGAETPLDEEWREIADFALQLPCELRKSGLIYVWGASRSNRDPARVLAAMSLWFLYDWEGAPCAAGGGGDCTALVVRLCRDAADRKQQLVTSRGLFRVIGETPDCLGFLEHLVHSGVSEAVFWRVLAFVQRAEHRRSDIRDLWAKVTRGFDSLCAFLGQIPKDYMDKALELFGRLWWNSYQVDPDFEHHLVLIAKLCRKPLSTDDDVSDVLSAFLIVDSKRNVRFLASLPESTWRRFDDACRSHNRAEHIEQGVRRQIEGTLPLLLAGLKVRVRLTMRVLEILGVHQDGVVRKTLLRVPHHPLHCVWLTAENYGRHLPVLEHCLGRTVSDSLAKLREMYEGRRPARRDVIDKILNDLQGRVVETLLTWIEDECAADLRRRAEEFGGSLEIHTLRLACDIDYNRRVFRRALRGFTREGEAAIWRHRGNRDWLAQKQGIVSRGWLRPHDVQVETESHGVLRLWIEQRFEEVLRMGTVVHSCLAIGGCFAHSVVANALDANKQFVVAFDAAGEFVARQLLALSEEGRLVCFSVYARKVMNSELLRAFAAFDRHLARVLGVPIEPDDDYNIKNLVCRDWYDDDAWNPCEIEQPARIVRVEPGGGGAELVF